MSPLNFADGEILLIDKPFGWTSFGVVKRVRYLIQKKIGQKIKVGHAGTLDPYASGLLILCTGKATKSIQGIQEMVKCYSGTIELGSTTPSFDLETEPEGNYPVQHITDQLIQEVSQSFLGPQMQMPPIFSAKMIEGKRAYKLARKGEEPEMRPQAVEIYSLELNRVSETQLSFKVSCSKGTYIRSLANDIGKALKSGAYLSSLVRESIGDYSLNQALSIEDFANSMAVE